MEHNTDMNQPVVYLNDLLDKHLKNIKVSDKQREILKESMQEVWYDEFIKGTFIELTHGMVIRFNKEQIDDREQHVFYRKLMAEECYENTVTLERYSFGKVQSISLYEIVAKIMPVYQAKLESYELTKNMAQA